MASLVEQHYIEQTLQESAAYILRDQGDAIQSAVSSKATGNLLRNRFMNVTGSEIRYSHPIYARFLDMKRLNRNGKTAKHKAMRIHNRFTWGLFLRIQDKLMYGLTEEVREKIQQSFSDKND